jgi:hypothetical protein
MISGKRGIGRGAGPIDLVGARRVALFRDPDSVLFELIEF